MTDKQRQEFRDKWMGEFYDSVTDTREELEQRFDQMLLAYDKLNGDKWARLKEFVEKDTEECDLVKKIFAEISRLEEGDAHEPE
jgi:uncharacterized protein YutD